MRVAIISDLSEIKTKAPNWDAIWLLISDIQLIRRAVDFNPDVIVIDTADPGSSKQIAKKLKSDIGAKVLLVVFKDEADGLDALVDDFIFKPFDAEELAIRVDLLYRRKHALEEGEKIQFGDLTLDLSTYEVMVDGRPVELTFKEFEMLKLFLTNKRKVFSRNTLLKQVWGYDYFGGTRTVDVHIRRLRAKLGSRYGQHISTVHNVGYKFSA